MKSQRTIFKWIAMAIAFAVFLAFAFAQHSVSAQDEFPPTPTQTPTEEPVEDNFFAPTPQPSDIPPSEGPSIQSFSALTPDTPSQPDPDCSDGRCVFMVRVRTDDAGISPACSYSTSTNEIYMGQCYSGQPITSGFRFANVNIPQGMIIQDAHIEFTVDGTYSDDLNVAFYGENNANALPFSNTSRPTNRLLTTEFSPWHIASSDPWTLGQIKDSPSLTAIVQKIVNRPDWVSGNAMAIILKNVGPSSGTFKHRRVIGYDRPVWYPGTQNAARLVINLEYDCSDYESTLSPIGQAVLSKVKSDQEYCGNHFDGLITLPPGEAAFERFRNLASEADYEIDFTTMIWDEQADRPQDAPGYIFLKGIKEFYEKVQQHPENYPEEGVNVRILVGLKRFLLNGYTDQRIHVLRDMKDLGIPLEGAKWKVEVALYRDGSGDPFGLFGTHSHVKLMIVDGKTIIVSGYNMQYDYLDDKRQDMGVEVSGPIATRALMVFDELWVGASRCDEYVLYHCSQEGVVGTMSHNPTILAPSITGDDIVFSLFRDETDKTADNAIEAAINAADSSVNIVQNRFMNDFWNPPQYARAILNALHKGDGQVVVNLLVSGSDDYPLDDLALSTAGICTLKDQLLDEDPIGTYYLTTRFSGEDKPIHTKALSLDGYFIIVGSQNFDASAWGKNIRSSYGELGDLAEYSLGIESSDAASEFNNKFDEEFALENGANNLTCPYSTSYQPPLQNVIDQTSPGSIIFIPAGVYTESVTINKPLVLIGAGANQAIFQPDGNQPAFRVTSSGVVIMNMKISGGSGYGLELIDSSPSSLKDIQIHRVVFENNAQGGVLVQGLISGSPMNYAIENNTFIGGANGITINIIGTQAVTSSIQNNIFYGQSLVPIRILSAHDSRVEYSYNLFDDCGTDVCATNWHLGNVSASSSAHDNLFDLNPLFSSPEHGVYQLSTNSPAIDAGDPSLLHDFYNDGDNDGAIQIDIGAFEYMSITNVPPVVDIGNNQTVEFGNSITVSASYSDTDNSENHSARINWGDGIVEDVSTDMTGTSAGGVTGQHTYTGTGAYTVEICVVDTYGGVGCDALSVAVLHRFTGFFPPVDNQPILNVVKAGSAIPIKFSLDGYQGLNIFSSGYPASAIVSCGSFAEDAIEQTVTAGASSLSYYATTDQYSYIWKTDKSWANTCRTFVLKLNDGSYHRADFKFKK